MYQPDNWVILKITGDDPHYKVLGGWSGGYTSGDSWRMNSGITRVEETETSFKFYGYSGSIYECQKRSYGLRMNNVHIYKQLKDMYGDNVELMDENTDWSTIDWKLNEFV